MLLAAGADPEATNKQGQKPADVATLNKEVRALGNLGDFECCYK